MKRSFAVSLRLRERYIAKNREIYRGKLTDSSSAGRATLRPYHFSRDASRRSSAALNASRTMAGAASDRRLFTSVLRFFAKHNFTKSKNRFSSAIASTARAPGNRKLTSAESTSGGGVNASGGISSAISGREKYCVITERYP